MDKRKFIRSKLAASVQITPEGGETIEATLVDLSLHGMLAHAESELESGTQCNILIRLGNGSNRFPIRGYGRVVRTQDHYIAFQFQTLGLGAYEELENSILLHCDDPEVCVKEFALSEFIFDPLTASSLEPSPELISPPKE